MAKKNKAVAIKLDKQRKLKFTFNAFCELEEALGRPLSELQEKGFKMKDLRALVWAGLLHESPDLTIEEVGNLIDEAESLEEVTNAVVKAVEAALGVQKKGDELGK